MAHMCLSLLAFAWPSLTSAIVHTDFVPNGSLALPPHERPGGNGQGILHIPVTKVSGTTSRKRQTPVGLNNPAEGDLYIITRSCYRLSGLMRSPLTTHSLNWHSPTIYLPLNW